MTRLVEQHQSANTLRFSTCGSVDDGKSTLIGRLLHDCKAAFEDQLAAAKRLTNNESVRAAGEEIDFSLLTDGLMAEREQGITIDVAYRYFSTPRRKFIIADTPGHEQYTRNMATGASTASLALILIDARKGVLTQTRRHAFITSLLGIRHCVVCVNKMDLVDYSQQVFDEIVSEFSDFATRLNVPDLEFVPLSALKGDNVVEQSTRMPWYVGKPLLRLLEDVHTGSDRNLIDFRYAVQYVIRPDLDYRGYAGSVASGIVRKGDEVMVLPSRKKTRIARIDTFDGELEEAYPPMSVSLCLEDELDVSRGDMIVHPRNQPHVTRHFEAMVVWLGERKLRVGGNYWVKHTTQSVRAKIESLRYVVDVNTLSRDPEAQGLELNGIGRVVISTVRPLYVDAYRDNRSTGSFVLIDLLTNATVGAGMLIERQPEDELPSAIAEWHDEVDAPKETSSADLVGSEERAARLRQKPVTLWLTGLPASGKREVAHALDRLLFEAGHFAHVLDGRAVRGGLSHDLGFSPGDRAEHLRRVSAVAKTLNDAGLITIASFVSPTRVIRSRARELIGEQRFLEVHVASPLEWSEARDRAGTYERARSGELLHVPGVNAPYEAPTSPAIVLRPDESGFEAAAKALLSLLAEGGFLRGPDSP
ncbi:MAG: sulfate adenylyltransferase subunit CysN [Planctomycetes bacterium]|nr:sulfate adenylyltransferase subunit CysN [Planctomycetota bacterium]